MTKSTEPESSAAPRDAADRSEDYGRVPGRIVEPGGGDALALGPVSVEYKLRAADGAGFSMIEYAVAGRFDGPPTRHWHTREHFVAYVLEGELVFQLAQGERQVATGGMLHIPGAPFAWSNPHDAPARFLCIYAPGGFEGFFEDVVVGLRERAGSGSPRPEHMEEVIPPLWRRYGIEAAGP